MTPHVCAGRPDQDPRACYCTPDDLVELFGEAEVIALTDRNNSGQINRDVAEAAIARAASEADSYLSTRYPVPVLPAPPVLRGAVADMARYALTGARALESDAIVQRYKQAVAWLQQVARGVVTLDVGQAPPPTADPQVCLDPGRRIWPLGGGQ